jgi:hypothetical protein
MTTARAQAAQGCRAGEERTSCARTVARWILPYGIQLQLRQARARRQTLRQQAEEAQLANAVLDPSERQLSQVGSRKLRVTAFTALHIGNDVRVQPVGLPGSRPARDRRTPGCCDTSPRF